MHYGFDIGGTKIEMAVFDSQFNLISSTRIETPHSSYHAFLDVIIKLVNDADKKHQCKGSIGMGIPGIIDKENQTVFTTNIEVVKNQPLIQDLVTQLNRPIYANNDANCFALSESHSSELENAEIVLGVILGTGLGGGLVVNRTVLTGASSCAGEIGHLKLPIDVYNILNVEKSLPLIKCGCGMTGCCERYFSGTGFEWLYQHYYGDQFTAKQIISGYEQRQSTEIEYVDRFIEGLSAYLGNVLMVIDADVIVFGGGLSNFDLLYEEIPKRLPKYTLSQMKLPKVIKAKYGDSGGTRGAALLAI